MRERKANRMSGFDYSSESVYFLTSCVQDRICCLGQVENKEMILNQYGKIVEQQILWLQERYPYFIIHNYVVMPNHVHILGEISVDEISRISWISRIVGTGRDPSLQYAKSQQSQQSIKSGQSPQKSKTKIKSIPELMGAFKTTSSKKIHLENYPDFKWQRSYHDHIVRNPQSFYRIFNYIDNNPSNWKEDTFAAKKNKYEQK